MTRTPRSNGSTERRLTLEPRFTSSREGDIALSIGEVADRAGVRTSAIRYYERVGVLAPAMRVHGRRVYDASVLDALAIICFARRVGFGVTAIRALLNGRNGRPDPERWREVAATRLREISEIVTDAERTRHMLEDSLRHKCPRLVERGRALGERKSGIEPS